MVCAEDQRWCWMFGGWGVKFNCETSYWGCLSWDTLPPTLEEKKHLQHNSNSSTVVIHCVQYINVYTYIWLCLNMFKWSDTATLENWGVSHRADGLIKAILQSWFETLWLANHKRLQCRCDMINMQRVCPRAKTWLPSLCGSLSSWVRAPPFSPINTALANCINAHH